MTDAREAELLAELKACDEQLAHANAKILLLEQKIDLLVRKLFGAKSEQFDPAQLPLLLQGMDEPGKAPEPVAGSPDGQPPLFPSASSAEAPRRSAGQSPPRERGPRLPEHRPVVEEVIVPEPVRLAPQDWRRLGEEVSERLDYEPARFLRRRTVRPQACAARGCWMPCPSWPRCPTRFWNAASWPRDFWRKSW